MFLVASNDPKAIPIEQVPILPLQECFRKVCRGYAPWTAEAIYVDPNLDPGDRAFVIEHERQHIRQARRYPDAASWKAAYKAAEARGYFHNHFEHEANRAAYAAGYKPTWKDPRQ